VRRLSFKTQFKIEFLGPFNGPKKSLKKTLILVFNHLKQAGQREYDKPDSGVNGQIKLMQQDSRVMCVNGPVRAERVWWPMGEFIDGDPISDEKGHLRNRRVIHYYQSMLKCIKGYIKVHSTDLCTFPNIYHADSQSYSHDITKGVGSQAMLVIMLASFRQTQ
jgi:hypothetical protein